MQNSGSAPRGRSQGHLGLFVTVVDVVADQISEVLGHVAVDRQFGQILGMGFQREHQQPQCGKGVGVHVL